MKYMSLWSIAPENVEATVKRFKEADPKPRPGAKLLGRWHEVGTCKGFAARGRRSCGSEQILFCWGRLSGPKGRACCR